MPSNNFPNGRQEQYLLDKPMPSSVESETIILGSILLDNDVIHTVIGLITPEDFYSPFNRRVFAAMIELFATGKNINPILIGEELKKDGSLETIGGITAIANLTFGLPYHQNVDDYVATVRDKSTIRNFIRLISTSSTEALSDEWPSEALMDKHEMALGRLRDTGNTKGHRHIAIPAQAAIERLKELSTKGENVVLGVPTGWTELDDMTCGYRKGDLIITAGRPSMGKTSKALQQCIGAVSYDPEYVVALFSLEMTEEELINRLICQEARINSHRWNRGHVMNSEWPRIASVLDTFRARKIVMDDSPRLSTMEIKARSRRIKSEYKRLDLIVIDHLGLVKGSGRRERHLELGEITKDLKATAKELGCPINALCQLSRAPELRSNHEPILSDLRESGNIEEDADMVELIYRAEYYKETDENRGIMDIILAKNRNGPTGKVKLSFLKEFMRIENYFPG